MPLALTNDGQSEPPQVYSTLRQELCVYYPGDHEWDTPMYYGRTLIIWANEWPMHYKTWLGTGE